jgi:16S rRNA (guanine(1405)-N(7))-methyltransferase
VNPRDLDSLTAEILGSAKYRHVAPELVARIGAAEIEKHPRLKDAVQATRTTLHQAVGAYTDGKIPYSRLLERLQAAESPQAQREVCLSAMQLHASTRERLPILESFYRQLLEGVGPINSILDVACGLNPLASGFMPLEPGACYYACDAFTDLAAFLNAYFEIAGLAGHASACDVATSLPQTTADVALVLKLLPTLERTDPGAPMRLLEGLQAKIIIVSFPVQTLGGKQKGMSTHYGQRFREMVAGTGWRVEEMPFATELCFRVWK